MTPTVPWSRLVRYVADDGKIKLGEPQVSDTTSDILKLASEDDLTVEILEGTNVLLAHPTGRHEKVKQLLAPVPVESVPFIRCIGLNYTTHSTLPWPSQNIHSY